MSKNVDLTRNVVDQLLKPIGITRKERTKLAVSLAHHLDTHFGPVLPSSMETCAAAGSNSKTAALFFDRVWAPPNGGGLEVPPDILFFGGSEPEQFMAAANIISKTYPVSDENFIRCLGDPLITKHIRSAFGGRTDFSGISEEKLGTKLLSDILFSIRGINVSPMFSDREQVDREFVAGNEECVFTAVSNLDVVNNDSLTWDQIREFRRDVDAKQKLRRMRNWLDTEMVGKPISYVSDTIATRLDDYEWALKKHGIETVTGTISDLLDYRFLASAGSIVGGLLAGGLWAGAGSGLAELTATGLVIAKTTVSLVNRRVDLADRKRGQGAEVAFVHELKKLTK